VLLDKEEKVIQNITNKQTEAGGHYCIEKKKKKTKVMRISR
jgi:hypothetical protein